LLYTQPGVLDDDIPEERQLGIDAGLAWRATAQGSLVYTDRGISSGMKYGISRMQEEGKFVEFCSLSPEILQTLEVEALRAQALDCGAQCAHAFPPLARMA
jgi:hypothetical protein